MGRYVRAALRSLVARPDVDLTLLVREPRDSAAYRAICGERAAVAALRTARAPGAYDCVWYPWNGIRFPTHAPSLVTINDDFAFRYPARGFIARRREQGPIRAAVRDAGRIVTISDWSRDALIARFGLAPARIGTIPLGPDPAFRAGVDQTPFAEPFVLAVGTGEARKNVAVLIAALAHAFQPPTVRLVLVGSPDRALHAAIARARPLPVTLLADVDDAALQRLYRTAAVVAVPSLAEGFGLVVVEAQACGAAVLAADTSALPEAVGNAGILLPPNDVASWSAALRSFVTDPALAAEYRARSLARWATPRDRRTADVVLAEVERLVDDGP